MIAATSLFLTTLIVTAMMICITINVVMVIIVLWKKPYLNDSALVVGEDHAERGKHCGLGTNKMLEIWMALGEIMLWSAAMGNAAMGGANAGSDEAGRHVLLL